MAEKSIEELRKQIKFNANKTLERSISPHDVFDTIEDTLDTLKGYSDQVTPETINAVYKCIRDLNNQFKRLSYLLDYGVICGDSEFGARLSTVTTGNVAQNPITEDTEETEVLKPDTFPPTVPAIAVKLDTAENFSQNYQNLIDGEPIFTTDTHKFFIYYGGNFYGGGGSGSGGISVDELMQLYLDHLGFIGKDNKRYRLEVYYDGTLKLYENEETELVKDTLATGDVWVNGRLNINSIFCGGDGDAHSFQSCSHNFVELANSSERDVNLQNLYLLYTPDTDTPWEVLPLKGVIKAKSSFLIRGAQCSIKTNTTVINVDTYDQLWYGKNGELIKFGQKSPTFYLAYGVKGQFYGINNTLISSDELTRVPYQKSILRGYIDSVGFGNGAGEGGSPLQLATGDSFSDALFVRYYTFDPVSQANKAYASHKTNSLWTYVNLKKSSDETLVNPRYYYDLDRKFRYTPKNSVNSNNIFSTRTKFNVDKPNVINLTFGKQATETSAGNDAVRCINWISVGFYDEYVEYGRSESNLNLIVRSMDTPTEGFIKSLSESDLRLLLSSMGAEYDTSVSMEINQTRAYYLTIIYGRQRWITTSDTAVTTHKVILPNLTSGTYYYRVRRLNDPEYKSEIRKFKVRKDSEVGSFEFIQTSDQQGFNWLEYQAWRKACKAIKDNNPNIQFTINTGDITQNGNRENEWMDYNQGRDEFLSEFEEMFTIGNNDLCGIVEYELGDGTAGTYKINHNNIFHYYCFQVDEKNIPMFLASGKYHCIPSLYSFNYGSYHFVSLNSEIATNTYKVYQSTSSNFMEDRYSEMAKWFKVDLQLWKGTSEDPTDCGKCLVYMHEMPYTIITHATAVGTTGRSGSKLNTTKTDGMIFYWSRIFKEYGIRLAFGGHKHTYSMTRPVYDAPDGYINEETHTKASGANIWGELSPESQMRPIVQVTSESEMNNAVNGNRVPGMLMCRYELVSKIDAPIYVMCQATGYKLVSNQEIPCRSSDNIHWLDKYFPGSANGAKDKANGLQYHPTYIRYVCSDTQIKVHSMQVKNIYSNPTEAKGGSFNINNQVTQPLSPEEIRSSEYTIIL